MVGRIALPELMTIAVVLAAMTLVVIWPAGRICRRLGFSPWLGILTVIPVFNLLLLWFVALADWPISRGTRGV
jgi:hypothetical protein